MRKLILQVHKTIVDRRCGEHQNFRLYTGTDDLFHQLLIAVFLRVAVCSDTIAEIMRLIDDDEIIVSPD